MNALLSCTGFELGRFDVPRFEVCRGELVHFVVTPDCHPEGEHLLQLFSGATTDGRVSLGGRVCTVSEFPQPLRGIPQAFRPTTCRRWLRRKTGCTAEVADRELARVELEPNRKLSTMAGNPRKILALAAARVAKPDLIVVTMEGMDPSGVRRMLEFLASDLHEAAALHVDPFPESRRNVEYHREVALQPLTVRAQSA